MHGEGCILYAGVVCAPFYPAPRTESWWVLVGDTATKQLLTIKRVALAKNARATLQFVAPDAGEHQLTLYAVCDSYMGADQEYDLPIKVGEALEGSDDSDSDSDEMKE